MKKVIGVVPKGILFDQEKPATSDIYQLANNYIKRVTEAGGIAVGLAPVDGRVSQEQLELCDGFIVQGGTQMWPYHFQVIHHAVTTGKKLLGICLGCQLIHRYYRMCHMVEEMGMVGPMDEAIIDLFFNKEIGHDLLHRVEGHMGKGITREDTECVKHVVDVVSGTVLHRLLGREQARGASFHNWRAEEPAPEITVNAWATDGSGTIEGLENGSNILGVQFHPEVDDKLPELFKFLTED